MKAEEWERIKALFDAALKRPSCERLEWLKEACGESPGLFDTVRQLIQDYEETSPIDPLKGDDHPVFTAGDLVAGRFLILRLLAHGGMGQVYEAADNRLRGIRVALKTLRPGLASEQKAYERFKREVWVAREIAHPGVCRVFDLVEHKICRDNGSEIVIPCLTMSLLEGESLAAYISRNRPLSVALALPIVRQLTECIQAMHESKIVHRDIKPSNIMLVPAVGEVPQVVLIDFGLAKPINARTDAWETRTEHMQAGAPYFIPPEALRGEPVGPAADLYALGLVIDEMVTTRPAYRYESMEELFWRKLHDKAESPSSRSVALPAAWERTILWCLDRDPAWRPHTASQVLQAVEGVREHTISEAIGRALRHVNPRRRERQHFKPVSRRKWLAAACAGAAGTALFGAYQRRPTELSTSILVLPFENLASQKELYEPLCLGTTEELIRRLSYVKGLTVLEAPLGWKLDEQELKGIRFSLRGTLHEYDGMPKLAVQLTDNRTGDIVWAESFEHELNEPLQLESYLTVKSIEELRANFETDGWRLNKQRQRVLTLIGFHESEPVTPPVTQSKAALVEYQRGRDFWQKRSLSSAFEATKAYHAAIRLDPKFALAYAGLADVQHVLLTYGYGSTGKLMSQAVEYAEKALAINDKLPECHTARAAAKQNLWAWVDSDASYRRAIQTHPRFARAHHWYAGLLLQFGSFDAALKEARAGLNLAPFDYAAQSNNGMYLWYSGRPKEAARQLELVVRKTNLLFAHAQLGQVYAYLASRSSGLDATAYFTKSMEHAGAVRIQELNNDADPDPISLKWSDFMFVQAYASHGDSASADNYINRLERGFKANKIPGTILAWGYAGMKQWKKSLTMLEYGVDHQEREMLYVKVHPLLRPMNGTPAYNSILKHMRLA